MYPQKDELANFNSQIYSSTISIYSLQSFASDQTSYEVVKVFITRNGRAEQHGEGVGGGSERGSCGGPEGPAGDLPVELPHEIAAPPRQRSHRRRGFPGEASSEGGLGSSDRSSGLQYYAEGREGQEN